MSSQSKKELVPIDKVLKYRKDEFVKVRGCPTTVIVTAREYDYGGRYIDIAFMLDGKLACYNEWNDRHDAYRIALRVKEAKRANKPITVSGKFRYKKQVLEIEKIDF